MIYLRLVIAILVWLATEISYGWSQGGNFITQKTPEKSSILVGKDSITLYPTYSKRLHETNRHPMILVNTKSGKGYVLTGYRHVPFEPEVQVRGKDFLTLFAILRKHVTATLSIEVTRVGFDTMTVDCRGFIKAWKKFSKRG